VYTWEADAVDQQRFESLLGAFKHRKPFMPFVIELADRRVIHVDNPAVAFDGEWGGFISADDQWFDFPREEVRDIRDEKLPEPPPACDRS
jgi:hypothetical protein